MRIAIIDYDKCKPEKCGHECKSFCPRVRAGDEVFRITDKAKIVEELCIGCGICVKKCPFSAITIVNTPEQLKEEPIHRFGENSFALFRLPFPVKGEVVGLLGENGLGKSTALKILSGEIEMPVDKLIKSFRGTELQKYLETLESRKIKTVVKPQMLFTKTERRARDILESNNENDNLKEAIEKLDMKNFLDRKACNLSGGELQRLAIATAYVKDADVYYFDEPSSYLDVKQRISAAKLIRSLSKESAVMVVEHDLAVMDFVADKIHIFYGETGCYGIVSKPYNVRVGINAFLDGFIKEDNIRIHEPLNFNLHKSLEQPERYIAFTDMRKRLDDFEVCVSAGEIRKKEIIGIFGENGLGKTTFAKMLAGEVKPDSGTCEETTISYKPQYIDIRFDGTVRELFEGVSEDFNSSVLHALSINKLFDNNVSNLSGGELQRLAIALCLSKDAGLYVLDEPSAYLDASQRINAAKVIRKISEKAAGIVIDHDLLFLNYISDRAILFEGTPGLKARAKESSLNDAVNNFLKSLDITFRKEKETGRPRANKPGSQKDVEQKSKGIYFLG